MPKLTNKEKTHAKLCVLLTVCGILFQKIGDKSSLSSGDNPAAENLAKQIDEILETYEPVRRKLLIYKIQIGRARLLKSIGNMSVESAFIGSLRVLTDGTVKTTKGTRLDWITQTLRKNLSSIEQNTNFEVKEVRQYKLLAFAVLRKI
jgi:hypothetical protein